MQVLEGRFLNGSHGNARGQVPAWAWDLLVKYGSDDTDYAARLTKTNDNVHIGDDEREAKLIELFAEAGIKVNFV